MSETKKGNMRDRMSNFIVEELQKRINSDSFIQLSYNTRGNFCAASDFIKLQKEMAKAKTKIQITDVHPIKNDIVNFIQIGRGSRNYEEIPSTGVFEIIFNNEQVMMIGTWLNFKGDMEGIIGGTEYAWKLLHVEQAKNYARQEKPKPGIFQLNMTEGKNNTKVLIYKPVEWTFKGKVIHPQIDVIRNEVSTFFNNIDKFSRYGQVPFRKLITVGAPGTGKSSINFLLAEEMKKDYSVIFSQDMNLIAAHMGLCAKHDMKTIVFYDDSENVLASGNSTFLNFLSGSNTPNMKKGCMIIFTSNLTDYIEDRVLRRPGRIDRIINISPLTGDSLLECAKLYFDNVDWTELSDKEWIDIFMVKHPTGNLVGLTGAEIQGLAQLCYVTANASQNIVNAALIKEVKEQMQADLKNAYNMMAQNSLTYRFNEKKKEPATSPGFKFGLASEEERF